MENIINGLKQIKTRVDSGTITTVNGTETLLSKQIEYLLKEAINYSQCCKTFYCNNINNDYKDNICKDQCAICKWQEEAKQ